MVVLFPGEADEFSLLKSIQIDSEGHKVSNSTGTGGPFFACEAAGHKVDGTSPSNAEVFIVCTGTILLLCELVIILV